MQLFQLWKDSLKIFIPRNFKLFCLVSLNAAIATYRVWLPQFWMLFVVSFVADLFPLLPFRLGPLHLSVSALISIMAKYLLFMTLLLSLRPSVRRKTYRYFLTYGPHIGFIGLFFFIKTFFFQIVGRVGPAAADLFAMSLFVPLALVPMTIFLMFYFDTPGRFKDLFSAIWPSGIKMVLFGLPFLVLFAWAAHLVYWLMFYFLGLGLFPFVSIIRSAPSSDLAFFYWALVKHALILVAVIPASFTANFYTKRLHDNYNLYFK